MVEYLGCCLDVNVSAESMEDLLGRSMQSYNSYIDRMSF